MMASFQGSLNYANSLSLFLFHVLPLHVRFWCIVFTKQTYIHVCMLLYPLMILAASAAMWAAAEPHFFDANRKQKGPKCELLLNQPNSLESPWFSYHSVPSSSQYSWCFIHLPQAALSQSNFLFCALFIMKHRTEQMSFFFTLVDHRGR